MAQVFVLMTKKTSVTQLMDKLKIDLLAYSHKKHYLCTQVIKRNSSVQILYLSKCFELFQNSLARLSQDLKQRRYCLNSSATNPHFHANCNSGMIRAQWMRFSELWKTRVGVEISRQAWRAVSTFLGSLQHDTGRTNVIKMTHLGGSINVNAQVYQEHAMLRYEPHQNNRLPHSLPGLPGAWRCSKTCGEVCKGAVPRPMLDSPPATAALFPSSKKNPWWLYLLVQNSVRPSRLSMWHSFCCPHSHWASRSYLQDSPTAV